MRPNPRRMVLPLLLLAVTAFAPEPGGWVVITVDDLPDFLVVDEPIELSYTVRQHGQTLRSGLAGAVRVSAGDDVVEVAASPGDGTGEYRAVLAVPHPGLWRVSIQSEVVAGANFSQAAKLVPIEAVRAGEEPQTALSETERGRRLFVAKGCVTCHAHRATPGHLGPSFGPDLTERHYAAEYLAMYLADPSIRPPSGTGLWPMPALDLDRDEILDLTAFINADAEGEADSPSR